jgi:integrase
MANIEKRVDSKGNIKYRALVRVKGHRPQSATFTQLTKAKIWAKKMETELREVRHFGSNEAKTKTVSDMIDRYLERTKLHNPRRYKDVKTLLGWWKKELGHCILADLTRSQISEKIEKLCNKPKTRRKNVLVTGDVATDKKQPTISLSTVNRYIIAFSHAFTIAINEWEWMDHNPMSRISKFREPEPKARFLNDEERQRLFKACQQSDYKPLYVITMLAISTGMRKSEITHLKWQDIDFERSQLVLHKTKNRSKRTLPIHGIAMDLLKKHHEKRRDDTDLVFPYGKPAKPYDFRYYWEKACEAADLDDFRFHDLRHTAASYMAMDHATPSELADVLGHKTLQMVKRYAHLSEAHTHSVVASMNKRFLSEDTHEADQS